MHPRRPRAQARQHIGGYIGKLDRGMHFGYRTLPARHIDAVL
jgi:hypothetical protein